MKQTTLFVIAIAALGFGATPSLGQPIRKQSQRAGAADAVDLSPRFVVGQPRRYRLILTMTQKQKYTKFAEGTISLQMIAILRLAPTRPLPGGGAEVELSFDRLSIDAVPSREPRFQYDTETDHDRPGDESYVRAIRRVAESVVVFELSKAGQVRSMVGAREIERLIEGQPGFELIASVLSEQWFQETAQDIFGPAGDQATRRLGDTWRTHLAITIGGYPGAKTSVDWTLKTNANGEALIEGDAHVQAPVQVDPSLKGLDQKVTGTFTKASIVWDLIHHRARSVEKSEAMNLEYRAEDFLIGTTSLGTHSLLESIDP